jgi:minor histocompatibility antigen H13
MLFLQPEHEEVFKIEFDTHDIVSVAVCLLVGISHINRRHWISNNLIGIAFSIYGIEALHLASFKVSIHRL